MISFSNPWALLVAVPAIALAVAFWRNSFANLTRNRARAALTARLAVLTLIILGLAGPSVNLGQNREASVVVADLSASDVQADSQMQAFVNKSAKLRPASGRLGVVVVGSNARVEQPVSALAGFSGFQTEVGRDSTNLEGGLLLANAILPPGYRRRITLISDGQENAGNSLATARLLHSVGVRVDVRPVHLTSGPEVLVDSVTAPSALRPRESFDVNVALRSTVDTTVRLTIERDQTQVLSRRVKVRSGENSFSFRQPPSRPGTHTFVVRIDPALDTQPENNTGSAFTIVSGTPRVLVIDPSRVEAANVINSLRTTGIQPTFEYPSNVTPTLSYLQSFASVVLIDTPVWSLDIRVVNALVPYVRDLGHGLVVIGGRDAYGMGGYGHTGLETALPVKMSLPKHRQMPSAAVVLIIEDLENGSADNFSKTAGKSVVALLTPEDQVAVNDACGGQFPVGLQHVIDKAAIDQGIDDMSSCDPMSYVPDLKDSFRALENTHASVKHIILVGDGDAADSRYERLVKRIRAGGVTVSTVATNNFPFGDPQTMANIAHWGGGRAYVATTPSSIPSIYLKEARTVARSAIVLGRFFPREISTNPVLRDLRGVTDLTGYVATTPKPAGEMILVSKEHDPVLAAWQFGLGRSVAWTSDADGGWTRDWLRAPGANRFWGNLVDWTLPATNNGNLFVSTGESGSNGTVSVNVPGTGVTAPIITGRVVGPELRSAVFALQPVAPGRFRGSFPAGSPGSYFATIEARVNGRLESGRAGLDVPYSAEYRTTGTNHGFLRALARAGGGSIVSSPSSVWLNNLAGVSSQQSLSLWLWLVALLLLPVDIGIRRLVVSRTDLELIRKAIVPVRRPLVAREPSLPPLAALRRNRAQGSLARSSLGELATDAEREGSPVKQGTGGPVPLTGQDAIKRQSWAGRGKARGGQSGQNRALEALTEEITEDSKDGQELAASSDGINDQPAGTTSRLLASKRRRQ